MNVAIVSPDIPYCSMIPYIIMMNAPVGPPICTLEPPKTETSSPATTAMDTVFPGDTLSVIGTDEQLANLNAAIQDETFDEDYEIEKHEMKLERIVIDGQSKFLGKSLMESGIRDEYSCMVVGLESDEDSLSKVAPTYCFAKGDIIWIVGEVRDLARLKSK